MTGPHGRNPACRSRTQRDMHSPPSARSSVGVVILLGLLVTSLAIWGLRTYESHRIDAGTTRMAPWQPQQPGLDGFERDYRIHDSSGRRWLLVYLPLLSIGGGALVGATRRGRTRAAMVAVAAMAMVPATALGYLAPDPPLAVLAAAAYAAVAALSSTTASTVRWPHGSAP